MGDDLVKHLRAYQQADQEGIMVLVSRQACDEAADRIEELEDKLKIERALTDGAHRRARAAEAKLAKAVGALEKLLTTAALLQENAIGCAVNHYGEDFSIHGMPGWLLDTQADIKCARAALAELHVIRERKR